MDPTFQAHPIPQNVTNFEFHLVGDMTIKQFGYLAAGLAVAFITFIALAQPFPFIAWPIIIISAASGAAFAFVPIQERPLDHWMAAFFKAIFNPTKLSFQSKILKKEDPVFTKRLPIYMRNKHAGDQTISKLPPRSSVVGASNPAAPPSTVNLGTQRKPSMADRLLASNQMAPAQSNPASTLPTSAAPQLLGTMPAATNTVPAPSPVPAVPVAPKTPPKPADLEKTVELAKDAQETQAKILKIEKQLDEIKATVAKPGADAKYYVDQFQSLLTDLQKLNEHASNTAHGLAVLANVPAPVVAPAPPTPAAPTTTLEAPSPQATQPAKSVPSVKLTSFPNVINGIVTDSQGNYVEGAVVVAHDKQGLPVRALRSNKLGQFVAATPLTNGTYTLIVEKDNLAFDQIALELKNEILPPVSIAAKKQMPS